MMTAPRHEQAATASTADWVVSLERPGAVRPPAPRPGETVVLAGDVIHREGTPTDFDRVEISLRRRSAPAPPCTGVLELRCLPQDLPDVGFAPATTNLDHVVHILCSRFEDAEAIERFLEATRGMIAPFSSGREHWLEVVDVRSDAGPDVDQLVVDEVFIGRFPHLGAWHDLNAIPEFRRARDTMEAEATTLFDLLVAPSVNTISAHR